MFTGLDNRRNSASVRQNLLQALKADCQQLNQPLLNQLIEYYLQTESPNALLLIKQFNENGKEQTKVLIEHLNSQGLKQCSRQSINSGNTDVNSHDDQEKIAHIMKVFRILCLIIHSQVPSLPTLIKDSILLTNCLHAITKCKDDPNILAQGCYFFAALAATLPSEIAQHTDAILNIFKATCKYLHKNLASLRQLSVQIQSHSLDKVQLWIVNQSAHALFYTLYTAYPCNFVYQIQRELQRNENPEVFDDIFVPMFQRVRLNPRLIENDRKRELDKHKLLSKDPYNIIYEARKLSLDPLFGRELPANVNWMHQEMKRILPFQHFKRQSPTRSTDQLYDGRRSIIDSTTSPEIISKKANITPLQKLKDKIKSFVRPSSASTPATTISTPDVGVVTTSTSVNATTTNNTLSIPNVSSGVFTSPSPSLGSDIRAVKTMPELQSTTDLTSSAASTPVISRSDQNHETYIGTVINTISSVYDQNIPSHWRKILGRYDPSLLTVSTPQRHATFYVSPSEHSLDNQQQQQHQQQYDDSSPTSTNEKRQRCASASCASGHHVHSPVLAAPTTSTDEILPRTRSLSTKQRTRNSTTGPFYQKHQLTHQTEYDEDDNDDNVLVSQRFSTDSSTMPIPSELYIISETKNSIPDEFSWSDHDFISIPHFDFNDIVGNNCSSNELKQFDRLYECHSSYEIFLTEQYRKIWKYLWAKEKSHRKHINDLQTACAFTDSLRDEVDVYLTEESNICKHDSKCLSDENTLLGQKVVELGKVVSRRKQVCANEDKHIEIRQLEENCEQLRKSVNNESLKLTNLQSELDDNEKEMKIIGERLEELKVLSKNISNLDNLNRQLECQYLRFTDEMSMPMHNQSLASHVSKDDDEQAAMKSTSSTTANGHDATSELDSISFSDDHQDENDDFQQEDEGQMENYEQLLAEIIEILKHQHLEMNNDRSTVDIENEAYGLLLEYMESKSDMQNYLLEHNTRYTDLYLEVQQDYIAQMEKDLILNQSTLDQMQNVAI
ncbi:unnamed protein product [Adineta ricciae]|uniref:Uncharacterized protein n=1 Tax=Adineta ricciae TaxID=249248 RepID=A0A813XF05_ADIRI|nr:unnamed protein product [Adineta ricciae]CAF1196161.1 unnamed protein product [Adineta ricciae]